jgi:hypothetical protein
MQFENPIITDGGQWDTNGATTFGPDGSIVPYQATGVTEGMAKLNVEENKEEEKT